MRFVLLDKITELVPGKRISALKALSQAEEYLADHFPAFPVLPGVLMIEALTQTAAMLVHVTENFAHSMVILQEVRNIKYKSFVKPGNVLRIDLDVKQFDAESSLFTGQVTVDDLPMMSGRIKLRHYNLRDEDSHMAQTDQRLIEHLRARAELLGAMKTTEKTVKTEQ